jgi:transcription antitermination factor NusG
LEALATQNSKWYIIRATPQADFLAAAELLNAGFEIFSPRVKSHQPKNVPQFVPLFPGYFFLKWDLEGAGKPSFHSAPHVSGWVNFEGVAPVVPDEIISELALRVGHINSDGGLWRRFEMGDKVRIVKGTLEGLGEVVEAPSSAQSRVRILMQFMGRLVSAQVPWNNLEPLEQRPMVHSKPPRRTRGQGRWIRNRQPVFPGGN